MDRFLDNKSLLQLSCVNRTTCTTLHNHIQERKRTLFQDTIYYLYYCNAAAARKTLNLQRRYDENYESSIRTLFHFLPELFEFLQDHQVEHFVLASMDDNVLCEVSHAMAALFSPERMKEICDQFIHLLSQNSTLVTCTLEIFYDIIMLNRNRLRDAIHQHPTLNIVTLSSWSNNPNTLWRAKDGSFYWACRPTSDPN
jgi:hypothetical protein